MSPNIPDALGKLCNGRPRLLGSVLGPFAAIYRTLFAHTSCFGAVHTVNTHFNIQNTADVCYGAIHGQRAYGICLIDEAYRVCLHDLPSMNGEPCERLPRQECVGSNNDFSVEFLWFYLLVARIPEIVSKKRSGAFPVTRGRCILSSELVCQYDTSIDNGWILSSASDPYVFVFYILGLKY